jgi:hypothetical protein
MKGSVLKKWGVDWIPNGSREDLVMSSCEHSNEHLWFMLCLVYIPCLMLTLVSRDRDWLCRLGPTE